MEYTLSIHSTGFFIPVCEDPGNLSHTAPSLCPGFPRVCVQVVTPKILSQPQTKEGRHLSYLCFKLPRQKRCKKKLAAHSQALHRDGNHRPRGCTMAQGLQIHPCPHCTGTPGCAHVWKTLSGTAGIPGAVPCRARGWAVMILVGPFQLGIVCDHCRGGFLVLHQEPVKRASQS